MPNSGILAKLLQQALEIVGLQGHVAVDVADKWTLVAV